MKFDYTKGTKTKYIVDIQRWNVSDQYYFGNYEEAKTFFNKVVNQEGEEGSIINLWDEQNIKMKSVIKMNMTRKEAKNFIEDNLLSVEWHNDGMPKTEKDVALLIALQSLNSLIYLEKQMGKTDEKVKIVR